MLGGDCSPSIRRQSSHAPQSGHHHTWQVVITIFLNLFFGIIIDTFGELRGAENERLADENSVCFICGIDRSTFDRNGVVRLPRLEPQPCPVPCRSSPPRSARVPNG